jgi:hypothetical protein
MALERTWSAWVDGLKVAAGDGGERAARYYAYQYAEEGEVIVREGFTARGRIAFRVPAENKGVK